MGCTIQQCKRNIREYFREITRRVGKCQVVLIQLKRGLSTTNTEDKTKKIQAALILGKRMLRKMKLDLITNPTVILLRLMILSHL